MNILEEVILNRSVILAMVEQNKLVESSKFFNDYYNSLKKLKVDDSLKEEHEKELKNAIDIYTKALINKFIENSAKEDWHNALIALNIVKTYDNRILNRIDIVRKYLRCLAKTKQKDLVRIVIKHLISLSNDVNEYWYIAEIYDMINDNQNSVKYMEEYINSKNPDEISSDEYNWCGVYFNRLYADDDTHIEYVYKSIEYFEKAHKLEPLNLTYLHNITILCGFVNEYQKSYEAWQKMLKIGNLSDIQKFDYSLLCMKLPNHDEWHKYSHARYSRDKSKYAFFDFKQPMWDGKADISNATLLVHYEQGFGDNILMYGYLERLKQFAKHIIFVSPSALYPLLKNNDNKIEVFNCEAIDYSKVKFDYYLPAISIPKVLNLQPNTVSVGAGYINVKQERIDYFREKYFNNDKFKIGISFFGNRKFNQIKYNKMRDIPVDYFYEISKLDNVEVYILNKNFEEKSSAIVKEKNVHNVSKVFQNFEDTAAAIENCDLVLSTDNCILNLAGALGKKTFGLFNWVSEWRWFDLSGDDVVWYTSVKPFVNEKMNDWAPTMKKIAQEIVNMQNN